jgi:hypothetical protein
MTAHELQAELKKDHAAFAKSYEGKILELTGTVFYAGDNAAGEGHGFVVLQLPFPDTATGLICITREDMPWLKVSTDSKITIRGKCDKNAMLSNCEIVEAGPNSGIMVSAKDLAADFAANRADAFDKYNKKVLYVEGQVVARTPESTGLSALSVILKSDGNLPVACRFMRETRLKIADVKIGSKVKVMGRYNPFPRTLIGEGPEVTIDAEAMTELP